MGRRPCCAKQGVNRGAWSVQEDAILAKYINTHGAGKWRNVAQKAGLNRCGKSCRLRWLNYLRPDIKRGNFTDGEDELIIRLHNLLGNKWALIAGRIPGRTDNEIKNYWNSVLSKKLKKPAAHSHLSHYQNDDTTRSSNQVPEPTPHEVVRTKAVRFTKPVFFRVHHTTTTNPSRVDHSHHHPVPAYEEVDQVQDIQGLYGGDQISKYGNTNLLLFGDTDDHDDVDIDGFNINDPSTKSVDVNSVLFPLDIHEQHHYDSDELKDHQALQFQNDDSYYYNNNNEEHGDGLMQEEIWQSIDDMLFARCDTITIT